MVSPLFKASCFPVGFFFDNNAVIFNLLLSAVQVVRIVIIIMDFYDNHPSGKMVNIKNAAKITLYAYGPFEFAYLALILIHLNKVIKNYCNHLCMTVGNSPDLVKSIRMRNLLCSANILLGLLLLHSYTLSVVNPVPTNSRKLLIQDLFLIVDDMMKNYITLSTALYLTYYSLLIGIKKRVLTNLSYCLDCQPILRQLEELETFTGSFESTLSILPLNWLCYSIFPGLCYLLTSLDQFADQIVQLSAFTCWNLMTILFTFYFIIRWQEDLDASVKPYLWRIDGRIRPAAREQLITEVDRVLKRKVTVWHMIAIDRRLLWSRIFFIPLSIATCVHFVAYHASSLRIVRFFVPLIFKQ